jgi:type VI secretion system protein ImpF
MSELVRGSSVPLFDRLASSEGRGGVGAFLLLPEHLEASIARELSRLFNTRSRLMPSEYAQSTGTVIDYGIPDFSALSPRHAQDRELLEASLKQAVVFYEPRLQNVSVKVAAVPQRGDKALVTVSGDVTIGLKAQRVSFELGLEPSFDNPTAVP